MKRTLSIFFGVSACVLAPLIVLASVVTVNQDVTLTLPSDSSTYTLKSGSTYNSLTVSGGAFSLTLDAMDQTTITDSNRHNLTNDKGIETICTSSLSTGVFSVATTGAQMTVSISPSGTCSVPSGTTGGGGGGGSGGGSSATPATPATPAVPATTTPAITATSTKSATPAVPAVPATPAVPAAPALGARGVTLSRTLLAGLRGNDVMDLQTFLASDVSLYPEGTISGYFGPKTTAAIQRFQEKYGIAQAGDTGYGVVGPKTRAKIQEISSGLPVSQSLSTSSSSGDAEKVKALQDQLKTLQEMILKLKK